MAHLPLCRFSPLSSLLFLHRSLSLVGISSLRFVSSVLLSLGCPYRTGTMSGRGRQFVPVVDVETPRYLTYDSISPSFFHCLNLLLLLPNYVSVFSRASLLSLFVFLFDHLCTCLLFLVFFPFQSFFCVLPFFCLSLFLFLSSCFFSVVFFLLYLSSLSMCDIRTSITVATFAVFGRLVCRLIKWLGHGSPPWLDTCFSHIQFPLPSHSRLCSRPCCFFVRSGLVCALWLVTACVVSLSLLRSSFFFFVARFSSPPSLVSC